MNIFKSPSTQKYVLPDVTSLGCLSLTVKSDVHSLKLEH